jgi:hypothetical protein
LPTVCGLAPVTATPFMSRAATPAVNPLSGTWQVAHDWRLGTEMLSKNTCLPSASSAATSGAAVAVPTESATAALDAKPSIFVLMIPRGRIRRRAALDHPEIVQAPNAPVVDFWRTLGLDGARRQVRWSSCWHFLNGCLEKIHLVLRLSKFAWHLVRERTAVYARRPEGAWWVRCNPDAGNRRGAKLTYLGAAPTRAAPFARSSSLSASMSG